MVENQKSIYIGTSGYKFDDWVGTFYPSSIEKQDMLDFYCNHFNLLEITYTYYKLPSYGVIINILERSKGRCNFSLRLPHFFLKGKYNKEDLKNFMSAVSPIVESGKLFCFFADFNYRFNSSKNNLEYLLRLKSEFNDLPLFVELINKTWYKERFLEEIANAGIGLVTVDLPDIQGLAPFYPTHLNGKVYVRLYGKSKLWLTPDAKELNYTYEDPVLHRLANSIKQFDNGTHTAVSFCNVINASAPLNALRFKEILKGI